MPKYIEIFNKYQNSQNADYRATEKLLLKMQSNPTLLEMQTKGRHAIKTEPISDLMRQAIFLRSWEILLGWEASYLCIKKNTFIRQYDHTSTYCHGDISNEIKDLFSQEKYVILWVSETSLEGGMFRCKQV